MSSFPAGRNQSKVNSLLHTNPQSIDDDDALDRESIAYEHSNYVPTSDQLSATGFQNFDPWKHMRLTEDGYMTPSVLIYGPRGSGKTQIMKHYLSTLHLKGKKNHYDEGYLFSNTAKLQPQTYDFLPSQNIYNGFNEKVIEDIFNKQLIDVSQKKKLLMEKIKNEKEQQGFKGRSYPDNSSAKPTGKGTEEKTEKGKAHKPVFKKIVIILDDVISDPKVRSSTILKRLFTEGRHIMISPIALSQEIGGLDSFRPVLRTNTDLILSFAAGNEKDREMISSRYLSKINKKIGSQVLQNITDEMYSSCAIFYNNYANSHSYQDYVYKYRAPHTIPPFFIGRKLDAKEPDVKTGGKGLIQFNVQVPKYSSSVLNNGLQYFGNYIIGTD